MVGVLTPLIIKDLFFIMFLPHINASRMLNVAANKNYVTNGPKRQTDVVKGKKKRAGKARCSFSHSALRNQKYY